MRIFVVNSTDDVFTPFINKGFTLRQFFEYCQKPTYKDNFPTLYFGSDYMIPRMEEFRKRNLLDFKIKCVQVSWESRTRNNTFAMYIDVETPDAFKRVLTEDIYLDKGQGAEEIGPFYLLKGIEYK